MEPSLALPVSAVVILSLEPKPGRSISLTRPARSSRPFRSRRIMKVYATPAAAGTLALVAPTGGASTDPVLVAIDAAGATKWSFIPPK